MAVIKPDEISSIIRSKIENFEAQTEIANTGSVIEVGDGIARIYGLRNVMASELVVFDDGRDTLGITLNLEEDNVGVVILGEYTQAKVITKIPAIVKPGVSGLPLAQYYTKEYIKIALESNEDLKNRIVKVRIENDSQIMH